MKKAINKAEPVINQANQQGRIGRRVVGLLFLLVLILAVFVRYDSLHKKYSHPDEVIAVKVTDMLINQGTLDSNWANAELPNMFKYPQYNFSGYLLVSAAVVAVMQCLSIDNSLEVLRHFSMLLGLLMIGLTGYAGRRFFNPPTGMIAALFVAVNPLLFQDALYARPETFLTALFMMFFILLNSESIKQRRRIIGAALLLGFMIGIKISMLVFLPMLFLSLTGHNQQLFNNISLIRYVKDCLRLLKNELLPAVIALAVGFCLAVPYAIVNSSGFLNGVNFLRRQYGNGDFVHGLVGGTILERIDYSLGYFLPTMGYLFLLLVLISGVFLVQRRQFHHLGQLLAVLLFFVVFSSYPTFFERNFSHLIPVFAIFAASALLSISNLLRRLFLRRFVFLALSLLLLLPSVHTSFKIYHYVLSGKQTRAFEKIKTELQNQYQLPLKNFGWGYSYENVNNNLSSPCQAYLLLLYHAGNTASLEMIKRLEAEAKWQRIKQIDSYFTDVSPSTLHTYLSTTKVFLYKAINEQKCQASSHKKQPD